MFGIKLKLKVVFISHFPKLLFTEIHNVLNLNIGVIVLDMSLCIKFCLSVLKPEPSNQVFSVISGFFEAILHAMNYNLIITFICLVKRWVMFMKEAIADFQNLNNLAKNARQEKNDGVVRVKVN